MATKFVTIDEAKKYLGQKVRIEGKTVDCPCCGQQVRYNKTSLNSSMVGVLVELYKATMQGKGDRNGYIHVEKYLQSLGKYVSSHSHGKLKNWGLLEEGVNKDPNKKNGGMWRLTSDGIGFVQGQLKVPQYAILYNEKVKWTEGPEITIQQALKHPFNYQEFLNPGASHNPNVNQPMLDVSLA